MNAVRVYCRYFVITRPFQYAMKRTPIRMMVMIAAAWLLSALISIPPLLFDRSEVHPDQCAVSQEIGYQLYATFGAFYIPMTVMIVIYYRIYMVIVIVVVIVTVYTWCRRGWLTPRRDLSQSPLP